MQSITAYGKPRIATLIKYGKSELTPPSPGEIPQAIGQAASLIKSATTMKWRHCTVKVNYHYEQSLFGVIIKKHIFGCYILKFTKSQTSMFKMIKSDKISNSGHLD